jgi:integrase
MHLNDLARRRSEGRVKHARYYLKAIFEEAIDQEILDEESGKEVGVADATPAGRQDYADLGSTAAGSRIGAASRPNPAHARHMTETFRPSELFALRWSGFDMNTRTLKVTQTVYRGKLREYGKTRKSSRRVHLPEGLANELWPWRQERPDPAPEAFIFTQRAQAQWSKEVRLHSHRQLPRPGTQEIGRGAGAFRS